ncbi:MAG: EthD family reductase [Deltaproteobacteria bacterium]|nr:EthD family reductase [Deltaproteobacteria bacterium]
MARLVVMYKTPKQVGAFDKYYFETHVPIAKRIPGLRKYEVSRGPVVTPAGPSGFHLIATLHFDDLAAIQGAFASPEGQAAAADVQTFATGGADMLLFDSREV